MTVVRWKFDKNAGTAIADGGWSGVKRATEYFWTTLQTVLKVSNPRPYTPTDSGKPPRKRTGFLVANVVYQLDEKRKRGIVGLRTNAIYGLYHELGNHPWFFVTLNKVKPRLTVFMTSGKEKK